MTCLCLFLNLKSFPHNREDYERYYRSGSGAEDYYRRKDEPYRDPYMDPWNGRREPGGKFTAQSTHYAALRIIFCEMIFNLFKRTHSRVFSIENLCSSCKTSQVIFSYLKHLAFSFDGAQVYSKRPVYNTIFIKNLCCKHHFFVKYFAYLLHVRGETEAAFTLQAKMAQI